MIGSGLARLRQFMFDWMHVCVVKGIFNVEAGMLLGLMAQKEGKTHTDVHRYVQAFQYPARLKGGASATHVFEKRSGPWVPLACQASQA